MDQLSPTDLTGPLVVAIVYDGLCTFEFSIAAEVFGLARPELGTSWYRFASAAIEAGPIRAHGGLRVETDGGLDLIGQADLIVIPGWRGADEIVPDELIDLLKSAFAGGARIASICSGAFVLAAAGLLEGQKAATHWRYAEQLQKAYPDIEVDASVLYAADCNIMTSAGSSAGLDLMLHIVRTDFGPAIANSVARRLVLPQHRSGGQAQYVERPVAKCENDRLSRLMDAMRNDLTRCWTVDSMADEAAMSSRTLIRRFRETTGQSPGKWLVATRLEEAKRLLEVTTLSIEELATLTGFGTVTTLRHHFRKKVGSSPSDYRQAFA
jgi:AraC family transcriptional regulator, transcriptional activator FtrA